MHWVNVDTRSYLKYKSFLEQMVMLKSLLSVTLACGVLISFSLGVAGTVREEGLCRIPYLPGMNNIVFQSSSVCSIDLSVPE